LRFIWLPMVTCYDLSHHNAGTQPIQTISHTAQVRVRRLLGKRSVGKLVLFLCGYFAYWGHSQGTDRRRFRGYCHSSRPMVLSRRSATRARPICLSRRRNRLSHHVLRRWKGRPGSPSPHDFGPEIIARLRNLSEGWRSMSDHELEHQSRIKKPVHELKSADNAKVL